MRPSIKGQAGAAILVALLAALIILYVLFLPPADRAALLGDSSGTAGSGGTSGTTSQTAIIYTSPVGRVLPPTNPTVTHQLASVPVRAIESGTVLAQRDTAIAENNVFQKTPTTIVFAANPNLTRNVYLSMNLAKTTGGNLIVKLNGDEVYNQEPHTRTIPPITISNLQETNTLEITADTVGFAFWKTNRITLSDVKLTGDVTDLSGANVVQHFTLAPEEYRTMQTSMLSFVPVCTKEGPITITINGAQIYSGAPDCDSPNTLEIAPTRLVSGENALGYSTASADVLVDRGNIVTTAKKEDNKQFSFTIDPARVVGRPIGLRVLFADATSKQGYVILNGNRMPLTGGSSVAMPITTALHAGSNSISFEAVGEPFEIVRFEVVVG